MSAGEYDFTIVQGETFTRSLTWETRADEEATAEPVDLTGASATLELARRGIEVLTLTSSPSGGITLGGTAGTITITMSAAVTALLPVGTLRHALTITHADGSIRRLLEGTASVKA